MFRIEDYIDSLTLKLLNSFGERLTYIGLQGSYLRNEATSDRNIDIMAVIDKTHKSPLAGYPRIVRFHFKRDFLCGNPF